MRYHSKLWKILLSVMVVLSVLVLPNGSQAAAKNMTVHFIDVGQGDSTLIHTPDGKNILIDAGKKQAGPTVVKYLKKKKVKTIDVLIATHPDSDHIGGLPKVIQSLKVKNVYAPKVSHTTKTYKDFLNAVKKKKLKIKTAKVNVKLPVKSVKAVFVGPVKTYPKSDTNDWSAVLKVTYKKNTFLLTGDAQDRAEKDMMKKGQKLNANVLKVGHHGSKGSTSTAFLKKVKPAYGVISVGKNSYGHPTKETLNRLKKAKVKVYRTDKSGNIVATANGSTIKFNVKAASASTPSKKSAKKKAATYKMTATLNNTRPKQYSTVKLNVKGLPKGTKYKAVFHYKTKDTVYQGKIGKTLLVKISRASTSYRVNVNVSAKYKSKTYKAKTSFLPK
ncbi:ComEC/Rec2 family competence protein [Virgibacillus halophilus]|uniref:ComEC/Rec2 family competence protein n=1 Tax=Tigheibacillus halophilus TaxID=361280 RepID=A0ABU5C233_9BACI|nr:ComEC/Rec2 family competence protein [Virgibacillus halophilus]